MCGKSCRSSSGFEYSSLSAFWGFYSNKNTDSWVAYFCEFCSDEIKELIESKGGRIGINVKNYTFI